MSYSFNPFTGNLDIKGSGSGGADNFGYVDIPDGQTVTVPVGQEMVHRQDIMVSGNLMVLGDTYQVQDPSAAGFFWTYIPATTSVTIPINRLMLYVSPFTVDGSLMVQGLLKEVT